MSLRVLSDRAFSCRSCERQSDFCLDHFSVWWPSSWPLSSSSDSCLTASPPGSRSGSTTAQGRGHEEDLAAAYRSRRHRSVRVFLVRLRRNDRISSLLSQVDQRVRVVEHRFLSAEHPAGAGPMSALGL